MAGVIEGYASVFHEPGVSGTEYVLHDDGEMKMVERNLPTLNRDALRERKEQVIPADQAAAYVMDKHAVTIEDVHGMQAQVKKWQKIYETVYKPIRHNFAHKRTAGIEEANALTENIQRFQRLDGLEEVAHKRVRPDRVTEFTEISKSNACTDSGALTHPNGEN